MWPARTATTPSPSTNANWRVRSVAASPTRRASWRPAHDDRVHTAAPGLPRRPRRLGCVAHPAADLARLAGAARAHAAHPDTGDYRTAAAAAAHRPAQRPPRPALGRRAQPVLLLPRRRRSVEL